MLLLGAIALIAIGPKQLPEVMRTFGRILGQAKKLGGDFQRNLLEATDNPGKWDQLAKQAETLTQIQADVRAVATAASGAVVSAQASVQASVQASMANLDGVDKETDNSSAPNHAPLESVDSPQMSLTPTAAVALDEHRQMSFDFDKKES